MPTTIQGPLDAAAAIFIFKTDEHKRIAWDDAADVDRSDRQRHAYTNQQGPLIRRELCTTKDEFLAALRKWNLASQGQFLFIYAHGVKHRNGLTIGLAHNDPPSEIVTWDELQAALPCGVDVLWLIGCETAPVLRNWTPPTASPVRRRIVVTRTTQDWKLLIPLFAEEISMAPIRYDDELRKLVAQASGSKAEMWYAHGEAWLPSRRSKWRPIGLVILVLTAVASLLCRVA